MLGPTTKFQWLEMTYPDRNNSDRAQSFHKTESTTSQNRAIADSIAGAELNRMGSKEYVFIKDAEQACIR